EENGLAAHIAADEVGFTAQTGVDDFEIESRAGRARTRVRRLCGGELQRLGAAGDREIPRLREPLRREIDHVLVHVRKIELLELALHPPSAVAMRGAADDSAPELGMAGVAILPRDRGEILNVAEHLLAVDRFVDLFAWQQPPVEEVVFELEDRLRPWAAS